MMIVQELFQQADITRVEEAFFLMNTIFCSHERYSIDEKIDEVLMIKRSIQEYIERFATCEIQKKESFTIFIIEVLFDDYDKKGESKISLFSIKDEEAYTKVLKDFSVWNNDGEERIEHYSIDTCQLEALAGYNISDICIDTLGVTACCAQILFEFLMFGYSYEEREKNIQSLYQELDERQKSFENKKYYSLEEALSYLDQKILDICNDPDEKQYRILKDEFDNKVKDIEKRYMDRIIKENHQKIIEIIKKEYL